MFRTGFDFPSIKMQPLSLEDAKKTLSFLRVFVSSWLHFEPYGRDMRFRVTTTLGAGVIACSVVAAAHEVSRSESTLAITDATVHAQFSINLLELQGVDANGDQRVSYDELDARIEDVFMVIKRHFVLAAPDGPTHVVLQRQQIVEEHVLQADLVYTFDRPVRQLRVESTLDTVTTPGHIHYVRTDISGETLQALLTPESRTATFLVGGVSIGRIFIVILAFAAVAAFIAFRVVSRR
jgi:hypothetical protein